ncbi:LysR family transcriptional regulator [Pseudorhodoferax sp. Leaf267]|uniref:LysR family transcriptional regulator n=1 Tax=Pseudorhodoferax sp. Leaf267 TaxID=1736316 RepID=UPI0006F8218B|nr:LysR family transcriptional regulator [Pseudorhodoferax sp. Leaf267]KQP22673.1 LysR family transcriptional regulator [Pseudorhodoferax sp. Leaf267]
MQKLPDLEAWAIFAKVAETGSFAKAAADLGISQPTVSKALTRLEQRLKTMLFHRTSRKMSLTASGQVALERAARILAEGEAVEAEVTEQSTSLRGTIRLAAPMSFGVSHLAPALPAFMELHPDVTLDLHLSDELIDMVAQGFDAALRISSLPDSSLLARRLCTVRLLLVGAPAYFAVHGTPGHPRDLATHRALRYVHARAGEAWRFQHPRKGEFSQVVPSALRVNNAEALVPALRAGLGLAMQPEFLAWEDLRAGLVQSTLDDWQVPPIALHIVTPPGRAKPARVEALIEYLAKHFASAPWAGSTG